MTDYIKISDLTEITTISGTMYLEVEQANVSKKIEISNLLAEVVNARGVESNLNTRLTKIETNLTSLLNKDYLIFDTGTSFATTAIVSDSVLGTRVPFATTQLYGKTSYVDRTTGGTDTVIYTVPANGFYKITFKGGFNSTAGGYNWRFQISKNEAYWMQDMSGSGGAQQNYTMIREANLVAGDKISVFMSQNYGSISATGYELRIEILALA